MTGIVDTIHGWMRRLDRNHQAIVEAMRALMDAGGGAEIETALPERDEPARMSATIREVNELSNEVVISQPVMGMRVQPLVTNQALHFICMRDGGLRRMTGRVLSRIKLTSPGGQTFFGYRISMPQRMEPYERKRLQRAEVVLPDACIEVELMMLGSESPVRGVLVDLTTAGCELRSTNARQRLEPGREVFMKLDLPEPVGEVREHVSIVRIEPIGDGHLTLVALRFRQPIEGLRDLIASGRISMAPSMRAA